jgi:hypothetical protein
MCGASSGGSPASSESVQDFGDVIEAVPFPQHQVVLTQHEVQVSIEDVQPFATLMSTEVRPL